MAISIGTKPLLIKKSPDGTAWVALHRHPSYPLGFVYCPFPEWKYALAWCQIRWNLYHILQEVDLGN